MELKDLLDKPASECSDEELEKQAHLLGKLRIVAEKKATTTRKSNAKKRSANLLNGLTKEQLLKLLAQMEANE